MKTITIMLMLILVSPLWAHEVGDTEEEAAVFPQQLTARELLAYCSSSSLSALGRKRQRYCWGFVSGVEETIRLKLQQSENAKNMKICVPPGEHSRKLAKAYVQYAGRWQAKLEQPAVQTVSDALIDAYPCRD